MATLATERFQKQREFVRRLLAYGAEPYEHQPGEKPDYFVAPKMITASEPFGCRPRTPIQEKIV